MRRSSSSSSIQNRLNENWFEILYVRKTANRSQNGLMPTMSLRIKVRQPASRFKRYETIVISTQWNEFLYRIFVHYIKKCRRHLFEKFLLLQKKKIVSVSKFNLYFFSHFWMNEWMTEYIRPNAEKNYFQCDCVCSPKQSALLLS